ncbi:unnamed protein product, partial [marine sediment metagenome]
SKYNLKKRRPKMLPEQLNFLDRFDNFYQVIVNAVKEDKVNERDFSLFKNALLTNGFINKESL